MLVMCGSLNAQGTASAVIHVKEENQIPKEKVFMHYNTSIIFPGEYLYYNFHCLLDKQGTTSRLSKIGYVELVGADKQIIMRQKLALKNGRAQGDFFIPTDIPSGNYKLVAYTQWMRNVGLESFFKADITLINPYQGNQENLKVNNESESFNDSIKTMSLTSKSLESALGFKITTDQDSYAKRQSVTLKVDNLLGASGHGTYSLSVRQIATKFKQEKLTAQEFLKGYKANTSLKKEIRFLPELRGALLPVKVVSDAGETLENINVSMSIPGENYVFKIANSDSGGNVFFNLSDTYEGETAIFQILGNAEKKYRLKNNYYPDVDYSSLSFNQFNLSKEMANLILERSVQNQIENAFIALKKDTIAEKTFRPVFNYQDAVLYNLNDYTRFKTVKETMVEIIKDVWTTKKEGKEVFQVRWAGSDLETVVMPLLLLDGMVIQNHQFLSSYDARKIKMIKVLKGTYILGEMVYDGILVFESEEPIGADEIDLGEVLQMNLLNPELSKAYFQPRYNAENKLILNKIPDYRRQLYWKPNITIDQDVLELDFYTSDISGSFLIEMEGFTKSGRAVSMSKIIEVH
jgi:hypothetical protein